MNAPFEPMDGRFGLVAEKLMGGFMGNAEITKQKKTAQKKGRSIF